MSGAPPDLERLRRALRALRRGDLLIIAERAAELVPRARLGALLGDLVQIDALTQASEAQAPLLKEAQKFHTAVLGGKYYPDFSVNSRNFMERSAGTATADEFARTVDPAIADFADHERPRHLAAARKLASAAQRAALRALSAARR